VFFDISSTSYFLSDGLAYVSSVLWDINFDGYY